MGKTHRGKGLWHLRGRGRGTCPACGRTGIKLLYPREVDGRQVNVCKICRTKKATKRGAPSPPELRERAAGERLGRR